MEGIDPKQARQIASDFSSAELPSAERAMLVYAVKLTLTPGEMSGFDVDALRAAGWDDRAINDIAQTAAYFNYINRVADGLGVDPEPEETPVI